MLPDAIPVLLVEDDPTVRKSIGGLLELEGYAVTPAGSTEEALRHAEAGEFPLVLSDIYLPGQSGLALLPQIKALAPDTAVILLTAFARVEDAVTGMRSGAYDYVTKPIDDDALLRTMRHALEEGRLRRENQALKRRLGTATGFDQMVGEDAQMRKIFALAATAGDTDATVLLTGESGTGKSCIARAIHLHSRRRDGQLVEVSCGALASNLLESELFGHVRGAFTGAVANKVGKFELARGGTLLLDEIDTLDPALQVKLLRVLQEKRFEPVGGTHTHTTDVRVIAASNQDLTASMAAGAFRQDLYYRLNVIAFAVPPLRERLGDLPALVANFLALYSAKHAKTAVGIADEAMALLLRYPWPGNIRELENVIERGVILCRGEVLGPPDLPPQVVEPPASGNGRTSPLRPLRTALEEAERVILRRALEAQNWNRQATAASLQINRTTLFHKMKKLGLLQPSPAARR